MALRESRSYAFDKQAMDPNLKKDRVPDAPKPSEAEVGQALTKIEQASKTTPDGSGAFSPDIAAPQSWLSRKAPILVFSTLVAILILCVSWLAGRLGKGLPSLGSLQAIRRSAGSRHFFNDPGLQSEAQSLLARLAAGDPAAADQVVARSNSWTGKIHRTPKTDQSIAAGLNLKDLYARGATLQAQLALDGIPVDENGFSTLEKAAANPQQRTWALWMLGAIGNRGVDAEHAATIIGAYLADPNVAVRTSAVEGLAILGEDESIPTLLDRFRNDPSPAVQEQAAYGMAEGGMFSHPQRMVAAASLAGWVDDPQLSRQQRAWDVQALRDISGQNIGMDSAAWRNWYQTSR